MPRPKPSMDPILKMFLFLMFVVVPALCYLIFRPSAETHSQSIEQAREFATYIQQNPAIIQQDPVTQAVAPAANNPASPEHVGEIAELTTADRISIFEMDSQWKQVGFLISGNAAQL